MNYPSREAMLEAFGPFAVVFEPIGDFSCPYLSLLWLSSEDVGVTLEAVRTATAHDDAPRCMLTLPRDENWRPHLVAALALYLRPDDNAIVQAWAALDAGSWVAPQLAAVLSMRDSAFVERALGRLSAGCPMADDPDYRIESPIERHSAQGPAGTSDRSAKNAASLTALLRADASESDEAVGVLDHPDVVALVARDIDGAARIAIQWRDSLVAYTTSA